VDSLRSPLNSDVRVHNKGIDEREVRSSHVCLFDGDIDLPQDTPLYRYLSIEAFLYLREFSRLTVSKITDWPDSFEGSRYEFLRMAKKQELSDVPKADFYASCWTLQTEARCLFSNDEQFGKAQQELSRCGSAAMWETYCSKGGVRIKTTLGKVDNLLASGLPNCKIFRGKVYYEPTDSWEKTINAPNLVSTLLHKRVSYRSESEYRFILLADNPKQESIMSIQINDLFELLDEILISPATSSNIWLSRTLYNIAVGVSIDFPRRTNPNDKDGCQFCRISQLYSLVSETIGHVDMA